MKILIALAFLLWPFMAFAKVLTQKPMGPVTVIQKDSGFYILANKQREISIDDYAILSGLDLKTQKNYAVLVKKYPNISLWPGNHQMPVSKLLPGNITQIVFTYSVLNGCPACELAGIASLGFNFDAQGNYLGTDILSLNPPPITSS